jgi:hypothetical protein
MYIYKSRYLTRGEVWYDDEPAKTGSVDWIVYHQRSSPVPGTRWEYFYTYAIDLTETVERLQAQLNQDTAYKIRRARERDKIVCEECDPRDAAVLDRFEEIYNQFAVTKGLGRLERGRVNSIANAGMLDLSIAKDSQGEALVYHANYCDASRATQLYLPSLYRNLSEKETRNLIGRANRYLTWSDILRYKNRGLKYFDFGGWYAGTDPGMLKINDFKKSFGGQVLREYQCEQIVTLKGWLLLNTARLLKGAKRAVVAPKKRAATSASIKVQDPVAVPSA